MQGCRSKLFNSQCKIFYHFWHCLCLVGFLHRVLSLTVYGWCVRSGSSLMIKICYQVVVHHMYMRQYGTPIARTSTLNATLVPTMYSWTCIRYVISVSSLVRWPPPVLHGYGGVHGMCMTHERLATS